MSVLAVGCAAEVSSLEGEGEDEEILDLIAGKADANAPRLPDLGVVYRTYLRSQIVPSGISRLRIDGPLAEGVATYRGIYRAGGAVDIATRVTFANRRSTRVQLMRLYTDEASPTLIHEFQISFDDGYLVLSNGGVTLAQLEPIDLFAEIRSCLPVLDSSQQAQLTSGGVGSVVATSGSVSNATAQVIYLSGGTLSTQLVYNCSVTVADDPESPLDDTSRTHSGTCALLEGGTPADRAYAWAFWKRGERQWTLNVPVTASCGGRTKTVAIGASTFSFTEAEPVYDPEPEEYEGDPEQYWIDGAWCDFPTGCG